MTGRSIAVTLAVLLIVGGLAYLLWGGLERNIVFFVTPAELLAKGEAAVGNPVRLGGVVEVGTVRHEGPLVYFNLTDNERTIPVMTRKAPPQMFQEGIGAVVEGVLQPDGTFEADRLMVKHGNEYRPPEEGEIPQEIYRSLQSE